MKSDTSKPSLCIVSERWIDANPNLSFSTNEGNVYKTALYSNLFSKIDHLYIDKYYYEYNNHIDNLLVNTNYDIYYIIFLGSSNLNPTYRSLSKLKGKIIFNWPDTVWPWIYDTLQATNEFALFHLSHDFPSEEIINYILPKKIYTIGTPHDPFLLYPIPYHKRQYDVSFLGTQYGIRYEYLEYIKNKFKGKSFIGTGAREINLSYEEVARINQNSKIIINFCQSPTGKFQLKGRIFEAMMCSSLLLDYKNTETPKLFDYIDDYCYTFETKTELLDIINNVIYENPLDSHIKRQLAHSEYLNKYTPHHYWGKILELINEK